MHSGGIYYTWSPCTSISLIDSTTCPGAILAETFFTNPQLEKSSVSEIVSRLNMSGS